MSDSAIGEKTQRALFTITLLWAAILAATVIAFVVTILLLNSFFYSPKAQVSLYLRALEAGEPDKALAVLNASVPANSRSNALLTPEVVRYSSSRLKDVTLHNRTPVDDQAKATVEVSYKVNDEAFNTTFTLENLGKQAIFFDNWAMVPGQLPTVEVSIASRHNATIDGAAVNLPEGHNTFAAFYPGVYEGKSSSKYLYAPPTNTVVANNKNTKMNFEFKATEELNTAVRKESFAFLGHCTSQKVLAPTGCPFSHLKHKDRVTGSTIEWSVDGEPEFKLETQGQNWIVHIKGAARITAEATDLYTGERKELDSVEEFNYMALLRVNGDKVSLAPVGL